MDRLAVALLVLAAFAPAPVVAKDVDALVVVGADGRAVRIEPERDVLAVMLFHPASVYSVRPERASPHGGYVKVYSLGAAGLPAIPGRFYPATRALCFAWRNQAAAPRSCGRLGPPRRLLAAARRVALFHGRGTGLRSLDPGGTMNLFAAVELAFDRYRAARPARRPPDCLPFVAEWSGPAAPPPPRRFCIAQRSVYARGRRYPAPASIGWLARAVAR